MYYAEMCCSEGEGTLVEHYVTDEVDFIGTPAHETVYMIKFITAERYHEFITIHGGEKAV